MNTRPGRRQQPRSLNHAMELCLEHARRRKNSSIDRVADQMGLSNKWALYKWMENGRLPAVLIRPFEAACGADYVTRHLAHTGAKLILTIPTGRRVEAKDVQALQVLLNDLIGKLLAHRDGQETAEAVSAALLEGMEALAYHHGQIQKAVQPELDFGNPYDD